MFTINQLRRANRMKVIPQRGGFKVRTGRGDEYLVSLRPKPTCDCHHFALRTVVDIAKGKGFMDIWWCSHILAVFTEINYQGFRKLGIGLMAKG